MQLINRGKKIFILTCTLAALTAASSSYAFSDDEARKAILELRAQVKQINEQNQQSKLLLADKVDQLQQEVAILRGRLEELTHKSIPDATDSNAPKVTQNLDPQERVIYEQAADLYRNGRYQEAAAGFADFIESYPDSSMASDASFYLGSSQYAAKDFANSIKTLQNLLQTNPKSSKAADALLVMAADNIELNDIKSAKQNLQRILQDYPNSKAAETAKNRLNLL